MNRFRELICETKLKLSEHSVFRNGKYPFESDKSFYRSKKIFYNLTQIQLLCSYFFYFFDQLIFNRKIRILFCNVIFQFIFLEQTRNKIVSNGQLIYICWQPHRRKMREYLSGVYNLFLQCNDLLINGCDKNDMVFGGHYFFVYTKRFVGYRVKIQLVLSASL